MSNERAEAPDTGLILAAGFGSRLAETTGSKLKPLLAVGGKPLILRVVEAMERVGCRRVIIVVGFMAGELEQELKRLHLGSVDLRFVQNADYERANGLSVLAAKAELPGSFILTMSDHLLGDDLLDLARAHKPPKDGATLLVDRKIGSVFDLDDATKVKSSGPYVADIGKELVDYDCIDTGVFVATRGLVAAIQAVFEEKGDASLSEGVALLARSQRMEILDVGDGFWADVDTPEMLSDAEAKLKAGSTDGDS